LDYPAIKIEVDRIKAGQLNLTSEQITRSIVAATSSTRFMSPGYWLDKTTGTAYVVQVQYPEYKMNSTSQIEMIPVGSGIGSSHLLNEVASWKKIAMPGEYDRLNQQRYITVTANVHEMDLGSAFKKTEEIVERIRPSLPKGAKILLRGQPELLFQTLSSLQFGLLVAMVVIFLLMAVFFSILPYCPGDACDYTRSYCRRFITATDNRPVYEYSILYGNNYGRWGSNCKCRIICDQCRNT
jgi:multidrug efflux pump subunit AcrB